MRSIYIPSPPHYRRWPTRFASSAEPLALILREIGQPWAARVLGGSAVIALPTVILAFFYGQSRIFFTVARDGLLPATLARVSRRGTPVRITIFTAVVTSIFAGLIPLTAIAALANAGTLAAFVAVCAAMLTLRVREPDRERKFRAPAAWLVGIGGILGCLYLFVSLPVKTQLFFLAAPLGWCSTHLGPGQPNEPAPMPDGAQDGQHRWRVGELVNGRLVRYALSRSIRAELLSKATDTRIRRPRAVIRLACDAAIGRG